MIDLAPETTRVIILFWEPKGENQQSSSISLDVLLDYWDDVSHCAPDPQHFSTEVLQQLYDRCLHNSDVDVNPDS